MPAKGKSVVMTPDPYHTPGYGGFCPQFKYQIGQTFGQTTSRLLKDQDVASSGRLVLADIEPSASRSEEKRADLLKSRLQSFGDQKLVAKMVPGYTGFIPKGQHYFGTRYAEGCRMSICDFENDHRQHLAKMQELPPLKGRLTRPLKPIADSPAPYIPTNKCLTSPYFMDNSDPNKHFMSGYTGFVPRSRAVIGLGYPTITHNALNEFTDDVARSHKLNGMPITIFRKEAAAMDNKGIYPVDTGLVPHYTGHIPGQKFRYGATFGHSTENAMKVPLTART